MATHLYARKSRFALLIGLASTQCSGLLDAAYGDQNATAGAADNFGVYIGDVVSYESNIYKLPDDAGNTEQLIGAGASRDDIVNRATVGGRGRFLAGQQIFELKGSAEDTRYQQNDRLNYVGGDAETRWLWKVGKSWSGQIGAEYDRTLADFAYTTAPIKDVLEQESFYLNIENQLGPRWALNAEGRGTRTDHSNALTEQLNTRSEAWTGGITYKTPRQDALGINYTESRTWLPDYVVAPGNFNRDYSDRKAIAWLSYRYSSKTQFEINGGHIERTYDDDANSGNFSGAIGRGTLTWAPASKLEFELAAWRELQARLEIGSQYLVSRGASLDTKWLADEVFELGLRLTAAREEYNSDLLLPTQVSRSDRVTSEMAYINYTPRDYLKLSLSYRAQQRTSNVDTNEFDADVVALGVTLTF